MPDQPLHLVIVSERTRSHFHLPLARLRHIRVTHLTRYVFDDMSVADQQGLVRFGSVFELWQQLSSLKPDLIQGLEPYYGFSRFRVPIRVVPLLVAVRCFVAWHRVPFFFHMLENVPPRQKYGRVIGIGMEWFARWYARSASFILFANCGAQQNITRWRLTVPVERSLWGIWGADAARFSYLPVQKAHKPVVLFVGGLNVQKGTLDALDAFINVADTFPTATMQLVGDGPLRQAVIERITKAGLSTRVTLLNSVPYSKMSQLLNRAWILIAPSRTLSYVAEQVALINIEALMCGTPVLVTDAGSAHEFLSSAAGGMVVKEGDQSALYEVLATYLAKPSRARQMMRQAANFAYQHYRYEQTIPAIERQILRLSGLRVLRA